MKATASKQPGVEMKEITKNVGWPMIMCGVPFLAAKMGIFDATDSSSDEIYVHPECRTFSYTVYLHLYHESRPHIVGGRRWTINILRTFAPNCM